MYSTGNNKIQPFLSTGNMPNLHQVNHCNFDIQNHINFNIFTNHSKNIKNRILHLKSIKKLSCNTLFFYCTDSLKFELYKTIVLKKHYLLSWILYLCLCCCNHKRPITILLLLNTFYFYFRLIAAHYLL